MAVTTTKTNKPINPRGNDQSPKGYNRAALYSGKALDFDGVNDSVTTGNISIQSSNTWTILTNVRLDTITSGSGFIFDGREGDFDGFSVYHSAGANIGRLNYFDNNGGHLTNFAFPLDELFSLSIIRDESSVHFYLNGQFVETITSVATYSVTGNFHIGQRFNGANFLNGQIAGFKIFNTALTPAQVSDLYNNPEKIVPTGVADTALKLWLPMMEGAGTTAYDGSGNGNHGTISGATYVNGVGSPVSQTAVIDWNKGTNLLTYSEQMSTGWATQNITLTQNALESPDGLTTATKFTATAANTFHLNNFTYASAPAGIWKESVFAKKGEVDFAFLVIRVNGGTDRYGVKFDLTDGTFVDDITSGSPTNTGYEITDVGNGWYKCTIQALHTSGAVINVFGPNIAGNLVDINGSHLGDGISGMYFWGASLRLSTAGDSYVRTEASTQTTPVLLPQGLTSGRDITGVNLFENVRKQGALNLDGNSWAEVHDNASLDVSALTCEGWAYMEDVTTLDKNRIIIKWNTSYPERTFQLYSTANSAVFMLSDGSAAYLLGGGTFTQGQWYHIVGTYDGTTQRLYVNGSQVNSTALSITLKQSSQEVMIGGYGAGVYSNNAVAQPRIYNRALTAEEVERNYNAGKNIYK